MDIVKAKIPGPDCLEPNQYIEAFTTDPRRVALTVQPGTPDESGPTQSHMGGTCDAGWILLPDDV
ncbi:uncharacterized protein N7477_001916 [Penicillium maclennaniae]|uniref:uncharacterized protein n=1 Tax=Penicillium maclennaniae TaxID=1343394 RepID=UPI0025421ACA|nr:uncharacterized protein N7477_001916 [Penicillium maclennaniae]KAJ5681976.1 hypothetical protein N7477_001916 [Penicillium maclennaniae]